MNKNTPEKTNTRPPNEADKLLAILHAQDVLSVILKPEKCKIIIVKLGITIPIVKTTCLLRSRDGRNAMYLFACIRDPNHHKGQLAITGYRFDIEQYLRRPLPGIPDVPQALRFFSFAVAQLEGIDLRKSTFKPERPFLN